MIDRIARSPLMLGAFLLVAAFVGGGVSWGLQQLVPGAMGGTDRASVERTVHDYLLEHPEVLPAAMEVLRTRETAKLIEANKPAILTAHGNAWEGNPNGDVTVAVYMDYACGFCRASLPTIARLVKNDPKVRIVYHEYPVLSQESLVAARWSLAAAEQNKFKPFHDALYAGDHLSAEAIQQAAQKAGLDMAKARVDANSTDAEGVINTAYQVGRQLGMSGTPSWVIGSHVISGALAYPDLVKAVKDARAGR